jgi:hypothetical protein
MVRPVPPAATVLMTMENNQFIIPSEDAEIFNSRLPVPRSHFY